MNYLKVGMLSCVLLIFCHGILSAQAIENKETKEKTLEPVLAGSSNLILNLGAGFPTGDYADAEEGGAAEKGFGIGVEFQYNITSAFYIGAMYRNQSNPTDNQGIKMSLLGQTAPGISVLSISANNWNLNSYLVGFGTITEVNNQNLKVYTKMMLGLCHSNSPSIQLTLTDGTSQLSINQLSAEANNFAALFGVGFRFYLGKSVDLILSGDYFITHLEFEDVMVTAQGQGSINAGKINQDADMLSLSIGLVFKL